MVITSSGAGDPVIITRARRQEALRQKMAADAELEQEKQLLQKAGYDPKVIGWEVYSHGS